MTTKFLDTDGRVINHEIAEEMAYIEKPYREGWLKAIFWTLREEEKKVFIEIAHNEALEENEIIKKKIDEIKNRVKKIAFITYNYIWNWEYKNWIIKTHNREIYVSQSEDSQIKHRDLGWKEYRVLDNKRDDKDFVNKVLDNVVWQIKLEEMDHTYLYIGKKTAQELISRTKNLVAEKITYVICDCDEYEKRKNISDYGRKWANITMCECGWRKTMKHLLERTLGNQDNI